MCTWKAKTAFWLGEHVKEQKVGIWGVRQQTKELDNKELDNKEKNNTEFDNKESDDKAQNN